MIADIDDLSGPEIIIGSADKKLYAWHADGTNVNGWPFMTGDIFLGSPAIGDVYGDGKNEVVAGSMNSKLYLWDTKGTTNKDWASFHHDAQNTGRSYKFLSGTISSNSFWSGDINVVGNVTVNYGVTLTIQPGTILRFSPNTNLTVNGYLSANGTQRNPITFTSIESTTRWGTITLNGPGTNYFSSIRYANILYGTEIDIINPDGIVIENCNILNSSMYGINISGTSENSEGNYINSDTIKNSNIYHAIAIQNGAYVSCYGNLIKKTDLNHNGSGILYGGGTYGEVEQNDIRGFDWGIGAIWGASVGAGYAGYDGWNNRITDCNNGLNILRKVMVILAICPILVQELTVFMIM